MLQQFDGLNWGAFSYSPGIIRNISDRHVRATAGSLVVLAVSEYLHRRGEEKERLCHFCGAKWTILRDSNGDCHVWRNGVSTDQAILDWTGNKAVVECCNL